ncbi:enoyl-CoA hydratase/isomerase family protein [Sphingobium sufflavum]|uniref:enoyl-CoA hydratase/isomerase family protein n=1 Tax=Sphingobium sufflavum TaxID=1129547 RepID=UPI001F430941|nr:enoyl-CoA hydratase/isomerase family protein [Sphingobium sufflavum]MCE7795711.1 enoyl-CoA hydratase/isomerase family protein [Sphingobium sufflavum]
MSDEVLFRVEGKAGIVSLNRPHTIHALTHGMVLAMTDRLAAWANDPAVAIVLIDHAVDPAGDPKLSRGFCSGGDINLVRTSVLEDGGAAGRQFFFDEYRLNHLMFSYAKPIVAFMDGITMGGGVGISQPARFRVATEKTRFAMPETGIGLFPDVGGGWYLSRLAGRLGRYLGLTGARIDGADCVAVGLATHYLPSEALDEAKRRIAQQPDDAAAILDDLSIAPPDAGIGTHLAAIDRLFASDRLEEIVAALAADESDFARETLATLRSKSPQTCKVALRQLRLGGEATSFADNMAMEYRIASRALDRPDFVEGVRAVLVDKDHAPQWNPATPEGVSEELLDSIFAPLPADREWRPL